MPTGVEQDGPLSSSRKINLTYNLINFAMIVLPNNLGIIK